MTRRKNKQGNSRRESAAGQQEPGNDSLPPDGPETDARGRHGEMGKARQVLQSTKQFVQTCCLLCHRERKDWLGSVPTNGLFSPVDVHATFMPSLAQNLLGEMPLWICPSCRRSVEEEERRVMPEQPLAVSLSRTSCKSQSCSGGSHSSSSSSTSSSSSSCHGNSGDWDPSSFLSAHKLSGMWNSRDSSGNLGKSGMKGNKSGDHSVSLDHVGKAPNLSGSKSCPHQSSANTETSATSLNSCKSPKQPEDVCQRTASPGKANCTTGYDSQSDPGPPPNSPTRQRQTSPSPARHLTPADTTSFPTSNIVSHRAASSPSRAHRNSRVLGCSPSLMKANSPLSMCTHNCNTQYSLGNILQDACLYGSQIKRDSKCRGRKHTKVSRCQSLQICEGDDWLREEEDSSSERSSCTSSTNQKDGKSCDCCYCEFFSKNMPPTPMSRNYPEMREKLRSRLTKRREELPQRLQPAGEQNVDNRDVDKLLDFINSNEPKTATSSKAAKRARHKLKKKEKALQKPGAQTTSSSSQSCEDADGPASEVKLLQWPQLELERVNSFLTSRLEEIKNTIKDSIRASFSVYDLNLDVNDFPKKASMLEQNNLFSHLNGSCDIQEIDLDLSPLSLGEPESHSTKLSEDLDNPTSASENGVVKRLSAVPNLSRMIWVQSPKVSASEQSAVLTTNVDTVPVTEGPALTELQGVAPALSLGAGRTKSKKKKVQMRKTKLNRGEIVTANPTSKVKAMLQHPPEREQLSWQKPDNVTFQGFQPEKKSASQDKHERTSGDQTSNGAKESMGVKDVHHNPVDDVFFPKETDSKDMDEIDREVESFKRFCLDSAKQPRQKLTVNWTNFSLKKSTTIAEQ
ncbi:protein FAM193B [Pelodytes ibericus]